MQLIKKKFWTQQIEEEEETKMIYSPLFINSNENISKLSLSWKQARSIITARLRKNNVTLRQ